MWAAAIISLSIQGAREHNEEGQIRTRIREVEVERKGQVKKRRKRCREKQGGKLTSIK